MSAVVITITSGKGGVGKTTTTANLSSALAAQGKKVVAIDADIGLRNLDVVMGLENRIVYDLVDVVEGTCRLRQAMIKDKRLEELYLIPAAQSRDKTAVTPGDMIEVCNQLRPDFDYILIDSPAGIEQGFKNAVAPADKVVIVTTPEVSAVRDADRIIGLIEAEEKGPADLIVNRLRLDDEAVIISTNKGRPVVMENGALSGQAYRNIARRLTGEEVPFLNLEEGNSFIKRLARFFKAS